MRERESEIERGRGRERGGEGEVVHYVSVPMLYVHPTRNNGESEDDTAKIKRLDSLELTKQRGDSNNFLSIDTIAWLRHINI